MIDKVLITGWDAAAVIALGCLLGAGVSLAVVAWEKAGLRRSTARHRNALLTAREIAFARAREILAEDAKKGLTATFAEKRELYRMARSGLIIWRCTFTESPRLVVDGGHVGDIKDNVLHEPYFRGLITSSAAT